MSGKRRIKGEWGRGKVLTYGREVLMAVRRRPGNGRGQVLKPFDVFPNGTDVSTLAVVGHK